MVTDYPEWDNCLISRKELKQFMKRTNRHGFLWFGSYLLLLVTSGILAYTSIGTYWLIPAFLVYGILWCFSNPIGHELSHGTVFRTRWVNEIAYMIVSYLNTDEPVAARWIHSRHHTHTTYDGRDPEHLVPNPMSWKGFLLELSSLPLMITYMRWILLHSWGVVAKDVKPYVPESERSKMFWYSRAILILYVVPCIWAAYISSWVPIAMFVLPRFIGAPFMAAVYLTQHAGLDCNINDFRRNSRNIYLGPVLRFLYWNMNYHIEHHMFPLVPFHALPELHQRLKDQMPPANKGFIDTYKEIFHVIGKQETDPGFTIFKNCPARKGV